MQKINKRLKVKHQNSDKKKQKQHTETNITKF